MIALSSFQMSVSNAVSIYEYQKCEKMRKMQKKCKMYYKYKDWKSTVLCESFAWIVSD